MSLENPKIIPQTGFAQYDFSTMPNFYYTCDIISSKPSTTDVTNYCANLDIINEWCLLHKRQVGFVLINSTNSISMPSHFNIAIGKFIKKYKAAKLNTILAGAFVFPNPMAKMVLKGIAIVSDFPFSVHVVSTKEEAIKVMSNQLRKAGLVS
ncbi:MAG: hypothetical protein QM734_02900 [Cyclobacteriaceae bacterium]